MFQANKYKFGYLVLFLEAIATRKQNADIPNAGKSWENAKYGRRHAVCKECIHQQKLALHPYTIIEMESIAFIGSKSAKIPSQKV